MKPKVIVLGGGLIGSSTAMQLAMRGCECTVIEKASPGRHASGVNAGGLRQINRHPAEIPLSVEAAKMWHSIETLVGSNCDARFCGQVRVAESTTDMELLEQRVAKIQSLGYQHEELLSKKQLYDIVPSLAPHCMGAAICRSDGYARPFHALTAMRHKAQSLGVHYQTNTEVTELNNLGDRWQAQTHHGAFEGDIIVNATGAWANRITQQLGEPVPMTPKALMLMVTERLPHFVDPVMGAVSRKLSFKQMQNGTLIIGGALRAELDFKQEQTHINWQQIADSARTVTHFFPQLKDVRIVRTWAGIEAFMPDNIPVVGRSSKSPTVFHAFGFSAHGFQLSPIIGKIISQLVIDGSTDFPIDPFRINRFAETQ